MKMNKKWLLPVIFFGFMFCLPAIKNNWDQAVAAAKYYNFTILNENEKNYAAGITLAAAAEIWQANQDNKTAMPLAFYLERDAQMLGNPDFNRSVSGKVYEVSGDSALLFPDDQFLAQDDVEGCLISNELAFQLFGDTNPKGAMLSYGEATYTIRGIIRSKEPLLIKVMSGNDDQILNKMVIKAEEYHRKENFKEQAMGVYGLQLREETTDFQKFYHIPERIPNRISDFAEWKNIMK
jgi:hypothetical protein